MFVNLNICIFFLLFLTLSQFVWIQAQDIEPQFPVDFTRPPVPIETTTPTPITTSFKPINTSTPIIWNTTSSSTEKPSSTSTTPEPWPTQSTSPPWITQSTSPPWPTYSPPKPWPTYPHHAKPNYTTTHPWYPLPVTPNYHHQFDYPYNRCYYKEQRSSSRQSPCASWYWFYPVDCYKCCYYGYSSYAGCYKIHSGHCPYYQRK